MDSPDARGGVPIGEAAERLGVTVELLRKRAQRKTIPAYKEDGRWFVVLDVADPVLDTIPGHGQDRTSGPGQSTAESVRSPAVPPAALAQLEAIRDQWLQPLVDQLGIAERTIGRLEAERDALAAQMAAAQARDDAEQRVADQLVDLLQEQRDTLHAEVERLRAAQAAAAMPLDAPGAMEQPEPAFLPSVAAWRERTTRAVDLDQPNRPAPWWRFWERRR